jgi:hypothetical protein
MIDETAPCWGKKFGHTFAGGRCIVCGQDQSGAPIQKSIEMKKIRVSEVLKKGKKEYSSEMQALIDKIRTEFGDTAGTGIGSFAVYGALIKKVGIPFAEHAFYKAKSSGTNARSPKRLFIWFLKEEINRVNKLRVIK